MAYWPPVDRAQVAGELLPRSGRVVALRPVQPARHHPRQPAQQGREQVRPGLREAVREYPWPGEEDVGARERAIRRDDGALLERLVTGDELLKRGQCSSCSPRCSQLIRVRTRRRSSRPPPPAPQLSWRCGVPVKDEPSVAYRSSSPARVASGSAAYASRRRAACSSLPASGRATTRGVQRPRSPAAEGVDPREHGGRVLGGVLEAGEAGAEARVDAVDDCPEVGRHLLEPGHLDAVEQRQQRPVERLVAGGHGRQVERRLAHHRGDDGVGGRAHQQQRRDTAAHCGGDVARAVQVVGYGDRPRLRQLERGHGERVGRAREALDHEFGARPQHPVAVAHPGQAQVGGRPPLEQVAGRGMAGARHWSQYRKRCAGAVAGAPRPGCDVSYAVRRASGYAAAPGRARVGAR